MAGIKIHAAHELLQLKTGRSDTTDLDADLPQIIKSLTKHWAKTTDGHDGSSNLLCTFQQCDDTGEGVNSI